ncbi:DHHW protein [Desulfonispora thiosulfatigenes DSM 11270]|uniref:DHHW protein n=1 Tax=Desulfonispora thiosulfatigenes DSM 11270 TaxID=656914 RepID=A0A1W1V6P0_DESTI|nr:DHHW family protein [Desulfonispora thiosulfatigenes]SMB89002.1 DHHW protein [Desulfonispora thiosulfatigenes DSM 11270]
MELNRKKLALMGLAGALILIILTSVFSLLHTYLDKTKSLKESKVSHVELVNQNPNQNQNQSQNPNQNQGLEADYKIKMEPDSITDEWIYYPERVIKRINYNEQEITTKASEINRFYEMIPGSVQKYFMLVPGRIGYEPGLTEYAKGMWQTKEKFQDLLNTSVKIVDVSESLAQHKSEYLFFRTDNAWTARGAYYGAQDFLKASNTDIIYTLADYQETWSNLYTGARKLDKEWKISHNLQDKIYHYRNTENIFWQNIVVGNKENQYVMSREPIISISRTGIDTFVGGIFSHSMLEGSGNNKKTLLLIGNFDAKVFAPWLLPYYEKIYFANSIYYQGDKDEFQKIFTEYNIKDVLILEGVYTMEKGQIYDKWS